MSHDEVSRLASDLYKALADGDRAALDTLLHPDFSGQATEGLPAGLGGRYGGPAAMRREFWGRIGRDFRVQALPERFHSMDDGRLFVAGRYRGEAIVSGKPLDAQFIHVLSFVDGRIAALEQLTDSALWEEALDAGGALETIDYSVVNGVATICLNRPDEGNAIDLRMGEETLLVARRIAGDPTVRAVLIKGNGPALTVGGDISYFVESLPEDYGRLFARMTAPFHEAFRILSRIDAPIVAAAHGSVAGGGLGYIYAADIVLAAEGTKFVTAFAGIGLSGDGGGTWHLPRLIGPAKAKRMYLENTRIDAAQAVEWGLISEVVPADELQDRALALATKLASGPTRSFSLMRRMFNESSTNTLSEQLLLETDYVEKSGASLDAQNAIASFIDKRRPTFEGQ